MGKIIKRIKWIWQWKVMVQYRFVLDIINEIRFKFKERKCPKTEKEKNEYAIEYMWRINHCLISLNLKTNRVYQITHCVGEPGFECPAANLLNFDLHFKQTCIWDGSQPEKPHEQSFLGVH